MDRVTAFHGFAVWLSCSKKKMVMTVACLAVALCVLSLLYVSDDHGVRSDDLLYRVGIALYEYEQVYGSLPPRVVTDADGSVRHSWRTLLLPFMDVPHSDFDTSLRWSETANADATKEINVYSGAGSEPGMTSVFAVSGVDTMWPPTGAMSLADCDEEPSSTLLLVEIHGMSCLWSEPSDVSVDDLARLVAEEADRRIDVVFVGGVTERVGGVKRLDARPAHGTIPADIPPYIWSRLAHARHLDAQD